MITTTVPVAGMTCEHCVRSVSEALLELEDVSAVSVSLADAAVTISTESPLDLAAATHAITEAGYTVVSA